GLLGPLLKIAAKVGSNLL
uniref:Antimicrobial peptide 7 n=1 Tax=Xenopus tropicalis TaxID=8364 RepID=XT7_XENTR|nr:RecName: Full=Antimicrobial peptide 7; AltName: Full=XT-7 [Xenopus tropicalis]